MAGPLPAKIGQPGDHLPSVEGSQRKVRSVFQKNTLINANANQSWRTSGRNTRTGASQLSALIPASRLTQGNTPVSTPCGTGRERLIDVALTKNRVLSARPTSLCEARESG